MTIYDLIVSKRAISISKKKKKKKRDFFYFLSFIINFSVWISTPQVLKAKRNYRWLRHDIARVAGPVYKMWKDNSVVVAVCHSLTGRVVIYI